LYDWIAPFPTTSFPVSTSPDPAPIASNRNAELVAPVIFAAPALFRTVTLTVAPPSGCACTCVPLLEYGHPSLTSVPRAT
jgi:hypothetical protein